MKKKLSLIVVFIIVAAQLIWLAVQYAARTEEMENAPTIRLECTGYDPRDLFRGDYVSFTCEQLLLLSNPLFQDLYYWGDSFIDCSKKHWESHFENGRVVSGYFDIYHEDGSCLIGEEREKLNPSKIKYLEPRPARPGAKELTGSKDIILHHIPVAAFWTVGQDGLGKLSRLAHLGSEQDVVRPGEQRTPANLRGRSFYVLKANGVIHSDIEIEISVVHGDGAQSSRFRFYVPEKTDSAMQAWFAAQPEGTAGNQYPAERVQQTAEFIIRERNGLMVKQLYLNGIPYTQAIRLLSENKFPFTEKPLPSNSLRHRRTNNIKTMQ